MTKPIIVVTICYKLLCHSSRFLINNFLASTDIKVFGRTYLFAMLLLIGLALFLHPGCFCLAYNLCSGNIPYVAKHLRGKTFIFRAFMAILLW